MRRLLPFFCLLLSLALTMPTLALAKKGDKKKDAEATEEKKDDSKLKSSALSGLSFRGIGPALTSGRIGDIAINPEDTRIWYVAVASGGVWKTENAGTTWKPIFDSQPSYSIGCVTLDPSNPHTVWIGTGENNSQRSVAYGDGVYRSRDGGKSWENMGLKESEHIGMISVDPRDSNVVWVAAQGPLWSSGGDRGLYKTTDGGKEWTKVLEISEHTGVSEVHLDPRDPDTAYAISYQRSRRVWSLINGGPESGIHKTTDGGETWRKLRGGLPGGDVGRIGMDISPANPDVLYAIVEPRGKGGTYRSNDRGESWTKTSGYVSTSPQYYQELIADPHNVDRVFSNDTWLQVTHDGGNTWDNVPETAKHVDNHALWIDPQQTDHIIAGCDGGIYETYDSGDTWRFVANLPVTQFYKVGIDNDLPFYNVYGGTQDNFTLGGPSRTTNVHGIMNQDWYITLGGDGFQTRVDPNNPDIVYSQLQYGVLVRFDRKSGEIVDIQPQPGPDDEALRWNWDAPLIISPHSPTRLYFAANVLFRSDDRGNNWTPVSGDLTAQIDRNQLEMMGRVWSIDAVSKNRSTSQYGNIVALSESSFNEGLIYVGTDDGLVQVTADGGENWTKYDTFPGIPELTYVNDLVASEHDGDTVYAAFNNHKSGDFKPYLLRSNDRGATWTSIAGDPEDGGLPERGSIYTVVEDHENRDILFVGTEFGAFVTLDGGGKWMQLSAGIPTIAVRDIEIQRRENDLVLATFGRGFYILDDYSPLREMSEEKMAEAILFPPKNALIFNESAPLGLRGKSFQGDSFYTAPNPPNGAVFTYYLPEKLQTREDKRKEKEKELIKEAEENEEKVVVPIPTWEELEAEASEEKPEVILTVKDSDGHVIRRMTGPTGSGTHRVTWDLRFASPRPTSLQPWGGNVFMTPPMGPRVLADTYTVELSQRVDGVEESLGEPQQVTLKNLDNLTLPAADKEGLLAFQRKAASLQRAAMGAMEVLGDAGQQLVLIKKSIEDTPGIDSALGAEARALEGRVREMQKRFFGDRVKARRSEPTLPGILGRVGRAAGNWESRSEITGTHQDAYEIAANEFESLLGDLRVLVQQDLKSLNDKLEAAGAPWTPGRFPVWTKE